ncbi:MAG: hypothetical protein J1E60_05900 [Christensenellaceae bacterium]|nr:hypothetical protein [Christensenellaceae bacterium]
MDINAKITELVDKIKTDPDLASNFQKEPVATVEGLLSIDLPDDQMEKIVDGIKARFLLISLAKPLTVCSERNKKTLSARH